MNSYNITNFNNNLIINKFIIIKVIIIVFLYNNK